MKLTNLTIELEKWGDNAGKYTAKVEYEGQHGKTTLTLDDSISEALLAFIGPAITKCALITSQKLEASLQQSIAESKAVPQIEAESAA